MQLVCVYVNSGWLIAPARSGGSLRSLGLASLFVSGVVRDLALMRAVADLSTACATLLATICTLRIRTGAFGLEPLRQLV